MNNLVHECLVDFKNFHTYHTRIFAQAVENFLDMAVGDGTLTYTCTRLSSTCLIYISQSDTGSKKDIAAM